jgi:heme-degrading monooxygenase HmoA
MRARVLRLTIKKDRFDEAREIIEGGVVPALRAQSGFVRGAMLFDRASGDVLTAVLWESEDALTAWEKSPVMASQLSRIMPALEAQPTREVYDIAYRIPIEGGPTHARTIEARVKPGREEATAAMYAEIVEQSLKNQPGFQAALLLQDRTSGVGISITAWDSEAAIQANESSGAVRANMARVADNFVDTPTMRTWELRPLV